MGALCDRRAIRVRLAWLNTRAKRVVFVLTLIPLAGLVATAVLTAYFFKAAYLEYSPDIYMCHVQRASRDLGFPQEPPVLTDDWVKVSQLANKRDSNRFSGEVRQIESSPDFRNCVLRTYTGGQILNFEWMRSETLRFAFWVFVPALCYLLGLGGRSLLRWINGQPAA
jgi:hypothetical protein